MWLQYHFCVIILSSPKPGTEVKKALVHWGDNSMLPSLIKMIEVRRFVLPIARGLTHLPDDVIL